jgi:alkylated DNA nucleotide flippase Atl1
VNQPTLTNPEAFYQQVWQMARQIPPGRVATYGQLAQLIPVPRRRYARRLPGVWRTLGGQRHGRLPHRRALAACDQLTGQNQPAPGCRKAAPAAGT